jgi:hypothetical protein
MSETVVLSKVYESFGFIEGCKYRRSKQGRYRGLSGLYGYPNASKYGRILEHVYFYQQYHQCCMLKWAVVHHIDENPINNMPWNLQGMMRYEHQSYHNNKRQYRRKDHSNTRCSNLDCKDPYTTYINNLGFYDWRKDGNGGYLCGRCRGLRDYYKKYRKKSQP